MEDHCDCPHYNGEVRQVQRDAHAADMQSWENRPRGKKAGAAGERAGGHSVENGRPLPPIMYAEDVRRRWLDNPGVPPAGPAFAAAEAAEDDGEQRIHSPQQGSAGRASGQGVNHDAAREGRQPASRHPAQGAEDWGPQWPAPTEEAAGGTAAERPDAPVDGTGASGRRAGEERTG